MRSNTRSAAAAPAPPRPVRALAVPAAAALALLAAIPAAAQAKIVPGRSVAGVSLDDSAARVKQVLGAPERGSNVLNYRYIRRHGLGVYFIAGKVFEITVVRRPQATGKGIRVGSTRKALTKAHPRARCRAAVVGKNTVECRLKGKFKRRATETLFTVRNDRVRTIVVHFA